MSTSHSLLRLLASVFLALGLAGCSIETMAVRALGDALAGEGSDVFANDPDPDLVGEALPFALKTMEALIAKDPENVDLLLAACSGFTQYTYAYVELPAEVLETTDYRAARDQQERAVRLYLRARDYCFRALDVIRPGSAGRLALDADAVAARFDREHLELLYWTAGAWGSAISSGLDQPELVVDLPAVEALLRRCLALEPTWKDGTLHDALVAIEALPEAMGGSYEEARRHYERAVELSGDTRVSSHLNWAWLVAIPRQDRAAFEAAIDRALAVPIEGPDAVEEERLANVVNRRFAGFLRSQADELFLEPLEPTDDLDSGNTP